MTQQVEQQSCIKVCIKLEHSSAETIWMNQKAVAMRHWWLAPSSQQCAHSCITFCAECFGETSNHPGDSAPLQSRFGTLWLWLLPKLKSPLKGKRFQTVNEIQENTTGQPMAIGRTVWGLKVPSLKGTEVSLSYVQCFLYLVSSSVNVCFSYYMAAYLLDRTFSLWIPTTTRKGLSLVDNVYLRELRA